MARQLSYSSQKISPNTSAHKTPLLASSQLSEPFSYTMQEPLTAPSSSPSTLLLPNKPKELRTQQEGSAIMQLLNYCATHPDATIWHHARKMMSLHIDSNASYLSMLQACSGVRGHHYLSSTSLNTLPSPP
jgi:hypothetical protein